MSEALLLTPNTTTIPEVQAPPAVSHESASDIFGHTVDAHINMFGQDIPEIAEKREQILRGAIEIDREFAFTPEFLKDGTRAFLFMAIAARYGELEESKEHVADYMAQKEFIFDATALLALNKSALHDGYKGLINLDSELPGEESERIYNKYTNPQVTRDMEHAIENGLLDEVKSRLGITEENEDPYEIRVMNVGSKTSTNGMRPTMPYQMSDTGPDDPGMRQYESNVADFAAYENGLIDNTEKFKKDMGFEGSLDSAWRTVVNGKNTLALPLAFAEKLLYTDQERAPSYDEGAKRRDLATLEHEYTHTQGGLNQDDNVYVGISAEERRAELFSGDNLGYGEIKSLFRYMRIISGKDLVQSIKGRVKGGASLELHMDVARAIGMQRMLEFAYTVPGGYESPSEPLQHSITQYLQGPNGLVKRAYEDAVNRGEGDAVNNRFREEANRMRSILSSVDLKGYLSYESDLRGMTFGVAVLQRQMELAA